MALLWIDATYVNARDGGRRGGEHRRRREALGVATGPPEAETFWKGFLRPWLIAACAASSWSSPMTTKACVRPPLHYPCRKRRRASRLSRSACLVTRAFVAW
jgi:hypothetical protein